MNQQTTKLGRRNFVAAGLSMAALPMLARSSEAVLSGSDDGAKLGTSSEGGHGMSPLPSKASQ